MPTGFISPGVVVTTDTTGYSTMNDPLQTALRHPSVMAPLLKVMALRAATEVFNHHMTGSIREIHSYICNYLRSVERMGLLPLPYNPQGWEFERFVLIHVGEDRHMYVDVNPLIAELYPDYDFQRPPDRHTEGERLPVPSVDYARRVDVPSL